MAHMCILTWEIAKGYIVPWDNHYKQNYDSLSVSIAIVHLTFGNLLAKRQRLATRVNMPCTICAFPIVLTARVDEVQARSQEIAED